MRAGPQPDRELLDRLGGDDDVVAGADEQERLADARRHDRVGEIAHRPERRADPRDGGRAEAQLRLGFDDRTGADRKSTRLNSSHVKTSYAVFGLKKKKF